MCAEKARSRTTYETTRGRRSVAARVAGLYRNENLVSSAASGPGDRRRGGRIRGHDSAAGAPRATSLCAFAPAPPGIDVVGRRAWRSADGTGSNAGHVRVYEETGGAQRPRARSWFRTRSFGNARFPRAAGAGQTSDGTGTYADIRRDVDPGGRRHRRRRKLGASNQHAY